MGQWGTLAFTNLFSHMPLSPSLELDKIHVSKFPSPRPQTTPEASCACTNIHIHLLSPL